MPESRAERRRTDRVSYSASLVLLALNVIGTGIYLLRAYPGWVRPEEHGMMPITGEPFVWFAGIFPVVAVFLVLNATWGALVLLRKEMRVARWWIFAAVAWLVAVGIDFAHH